MKDILFTGGSGRLGTEFKKFQDPFIWFPSHRTLDITKKIIPKKGIQTIIHAAGYTDVAGAEKNQELCYKVNVEGTQNLLKAYPKASFIFISSEYAYKPVNYYSVTKALAEREIALSGNEYLIIRTLFKPRPYPYERAFIDQYTMGDYVDVIAKKIKLEIMSWSFDKNKLVYVGTSRKTIYELAKQTKPNIKKASVNDVTTVRLPYDYR